MRILLINHYAGSRRHGMEFRPFYMGREWVKGGHKVTVVAASASHVRQQAPRVHGSYSRERIDGVDYLWLKTPPYMGNGVGRARNIFAFVGQLLRYGAFLARNEGPDVVIASSTYPLDTIPALRVARRTGARLIYEVHDLWPLSLIELGGMPRHHPFIVLLQWAENFAYRNADRVVSILPEAKGHMVAHGMAPEKFAHVPNGLDVEEWERCQETLPIEHQAILKEQRSKGHFIVGYAGQHGCANALETLVDAARLAHGLPIRFVLVGQGPEKAALQRRARELQLDNTIFLPPVPRGCMPSLLASMDLLFIGLQGKPIFRFGVSPNKLNDYMMAARPIVYAVGGVNDVVAATGCGLSVPPEEPQAVVQAVERLRTMSPAEREAMGRRGREYVMARRDYRVLARQFLDCVQ